MGGAYMISANDLRSIPIFHVLDQQVCERFSATAADLWLNAGEWLVHEGQPSSFYVLLQGSVAISKELNGRAQVLHTSPSGVYFGEVPIFLGSPSLVSIQAQEPCRVAKFKQQQIQELVRNFPLFGEALFAVINERLSMVQGIAKDTPSARVQLRGETKDRDCHTLRSFLFANRIPFEWLPANAANRDQPIEIEIEGKRFDGEVSLRRIAEALGLPTHPTLHCYDFVIVGAGPAGMAAGVYAASEGLSTLIVERAAAGGQAGSSSKIENYLGFPGGISGDELSGKAYRQARQFGAEIILTRQVTSIAHDSKRFCISIDGSETLHGKVVLIASGVEWRRLRAEGVDRLLGRGVFYGASRTEGSLLNGKQVYIVGGGNSAGQAAMFLSGHAAEVHIVVRGPGLAASMSRYLIDRLEAKGNIHLQTHTVVDKVEGEESLERLVLRKQALNCGVHLVTKPADALFIMIGGDARTEWLPLEVERDSNGYIRTGQQVSTWSLPRSPYPLETSIPGLFCAGDVRSGSIKRVASSVGEGSMSVSFAHQFLEGMPDS